MAKSNVAIVGPRVRFSARAFDMTRSGHVLILGQAAGPPSPNGYPLPQILGHTAGPPSPLMASICHKFSDTRRVRQVHIAQARPPARLPCHNHTAGPPNPHGFHAIISHGKSAKSTKSTWLPCHDPFPFGCYLIHFGTRILC